MSWHVSAEVLTRYAGGEAGPAEAHSLEAHVVACGRCRRDIAVRFPVAPLEQVWSGVLDRVESSRPGWVERLLLRVGTPDHVARLVAATPSLQLSWFAAMSVALAFAVSAAYAGETGRLIFLIVAPLIPLAGVAAAYGPGVDPTYEVGLAAPMRGQRLLFIRAATVLATGIAICALASLALPHLDWTAAAWLLPALSLAAAGLALSSSLAAPVAFGGVAALWVTLVVLAEVASPSPLALFRAPEQVAFLACGVACAGLTVARREAFDTRRPQ